MGTDAYKHSRSHRKKIERLFGEAKSIHPLVRLRLRGLTGAKDEFLLTAGVRDVAPTQGPKFKQEGMVVQAALEGHGVALASSVLVADDIAAGRLCKPFTLSLPQRFAYYVVSTEAAADQPKVAAFRAWILAEANRQPASRPG